jgi:hypothetical protein
MPPAPPSTHKLVPSVLTALRGLEPEAASVRAVVVSIFPLKSTRPITRLIVEEAEVVILAVPGAASYPVAVRYCSSVDRVSNPSLVEVPLAVSIRFGPLTTVGMGMD